MGRPDRPLTTGVLTLTNTTVPTDFDERVHSIVEKIPAGKVLSYGAISEILNDQGVGGGPRNVGRAMSLSGGLPWWRVVRADGRFPACHAGEALEHYRSEQTPLRSDEAVDIPNAMWDGL